MSSAHISPANLVTGDSMNRNEFLERWESLPELKNAELIEGFVHVPSPVSREHGRLDTRIISLLDTYATHTPGCEAGNNQTWLMGDSAPQPDAVLVILPEHGGQARFDGKYWNGAPELAVEVCLTTSEVDFGSKARLYQKTGVREYVTIESFIKRIVWRRLIDGTFHELNADNDGCYRSAVFPGLWLDAAALLAGDRARLAETLARGISTPEHQAFALSLKAANRRAV